MKAIRDNNLFFICKENKIQTAVVVSGIGQLKDITLGYFKEKGHYCEESFENTYELVHLSGTIIHQDDTYIPHLHVTLADKRKQVIGGHLIKGIVETTNEIVLLVSSVPLKREISVKTGLNELIIPTET